MNRAGLETVLMNYYRHIDREKLQFDFLTHRSEKWDYDDEILSLGGRIYHVPPIRLTGFLKYRKALRKFFEEHPEYTVIHSHIDALSTFPLLAAKKAGVPVRIAHSHTASFDKDAKLPLRYLSKWFLPRAATHFRACSKSAGLFMFGRKACSSSRFAVMRNAIETERFAFSIKNRIAVRKELGIEDNFVVGHIGRFSPTKNHGFLTAIFEELLKKDNNAKLMLVGEYEGDERKMQMSAQPGLADSVILLGSRTDIPELLHAMDAFVLPSLYEGLPLVLVEAQAAGLVCFASAGAVPEEANVAGLVKYISLNESPAVWAEAILECRGLPRYNTAEHVRSSGYDINSTAEELSSFYFECAKESRT